jgi:hypothetical protein
VEFLEHAQMMRTKCRARRAWPGDEACFLANGRGGSQPPGAFAVRENRCRVRSWWLPINLATSKNTGLPLGIEFSILRYPIPTGGQPGKDARASPSQSNEDKQGAGARSRQATGASARRGRRHDEESATPGACGPGQRRQRQLPFVAPPTHVTSRAVQAWPEPAPASSPQLDG